MATTEKKSLYEKFVFLFGKIEKRRRFIFSTFILTALILFTTFFSFEEIPFLLPLVIGIVYIMTFFSILEGITKKEWTMLFIHPVFFSTIIYLFYFFLPQRWLTRLPFIAIYTISIYAILLSQNIFNVGVSKSLQLFRAAFSVNYLFLTISAFFAYSLIISLRMNPFMNFILVFLSSYPLALQFLWSISPSDTIEKSIIRLSFLIAFILGEGALILSFIPVNQSIFALTLTSVFYCLCGLIQTYIQETLFKERIREYIFVLIFTLVIFILSLRW